MYAQLNFMSVKDLGLKPQQLMTLDMAKVGHRNLSPERFQVIKDKLLAIEGVEAVTRATEEPINDSGFESELTFASKTLNLESHYVDLDFLNVIGAKVVAGRNFAPELAATDTVSSILLNETAFRQLGLRSINQQIAVKHGDELKRFNVIGKVKDIQAYGFESVVGPSAYFASDYQFHGRKNIILRLNNQDFSTTVAKIVKLWMQIEPGKDPYFTFADETLVKMNETYATSQRIIFCFGLLTFLISIFGLIGFAAYNAKLRLKEVAVRRILGASTSSLLQLLNFDFLVLLLFANFLGDLLAYIYMEKWFATFAYRVEMPWAVFIGTNAFVVFATILVVSLQSLKAIYMKPVTVLKYE